ncbi:hypothetical protein QBC38DRAFT_530412 [Podospora fimiseda]|uniref:Uncharacterized protein n=1 Tax=Podospora fimiseda TaxID=252190 RepID=A0AAN7BLX4_9PEZI|nr:hypothetical protein QBC38DRAFT_530412 [Podospora fimiseda]
MELTPKNWECALSASAGTTASEYFHTRKVEFGPPEGEYQEFNYLKRRLYEPMVAESQMLHGPPKPVVYEAMLSTMPNLEILIMHRPHLFSRIFLPALNQLVTLKLYNSPLNKPRLQRLLTITPNLEHLEIFQNVPVRLDRPELFFAMNKILRLTAPELLSCFENHPCSSKITTLAIRARIKDDSDDTDDITDFVPSPPLLPITQFPNLRFLAVHYEHLDFGWKKGPCIANLIKHCQKLDHLFLFGVKDLLRCNFEGFVRLKRITLMPHEDQKDPGKNWSNSVQNQIKDPKWACGGSTC